jgi:hypothetical protein
MHDAARIIDWQCPRRWRPGASAIVSIATHSIDARDIVRGANAAELPPSA